MTGCPFSGVTDAPAAFGHFLAPTGSSWIEPWKVDRHRDGGTLPSAVEGRTRDLLSRLARARSGYEDESLDPNTALPAGYTYLLQFMAHDLVNSEQPAWSPPPGRAPANRRANRLNLDTLYGAGPQGAPHMYDGPRFRIGASAEPPAADRPVVGRQRDIVRLASVRGGWTRPCPVVADPGNDSHAIIVQLTTLFMKLHNTVVDRLAPDGAAPDAVADAALFDRARAVVTLAYRHVIRHEVLPKILADDVVLHYESEAPCFIDEAFLRDPQAPLPLEFSHGAFRFGHAMLRPGYVFNMRRPAEFPFEIREVLRQASNRSRYPGPLRPDWLVTWSNFFPMSGAGRSRAFNRSRLIHPGTQWRLDDPGLFAPEINDEVHGLGIRDLHSASAAGLWSVDALITRIRETACGARLLPGAVESRTERCRARMRGWLEATRPDDMTDDDIDAIVADPPLPYFVVHEAWHQCKGTRLGTLGSILVGDVIYAILQQGKLPVPHGRPLHESLIARGHLKPSMALYLAPKLSSMDAIIRFVADQDDLADADPPFA